MNPFEQIASMLDTQMKARASQALSGVPCMLGTITAGGLKLDLYKNVIADYMIADWELKIEIPQASRVIRTAAPVNPDGSDIPGTTQYSDFSRLDFNVQGIGDPDATKEVHLDLKASLKPGDRILAIPVNGGQDAVVICKVVTSGA
ncbi:MAG: hypothetical protein A4E56_00127 [Pelotomaculum sp. PtaU1.Bin065]|nr:MAG: hypothetical protein A4E56_00127 [Pelotomaculum sp. PtaU1.Bin065]